MKPIAKIALACLTAALVIPAGAFANDPELMAIDNHHGSVTYLRRPTEVQAQTQSKTTIAFFAHGRGIGSPAERSERGELRSMSVSTPEGGPVSFYGPAR